MAAGPPSQAHLDKPEQDPTLDNKVRTTLDGLLKRAADLAGIVRYWSSLPDSILQSREETEKVVHSGSGKGVLFSGASDGADTRFGIRARAANYDVVHFLGPRNEPSTEAAEQQAQQLMRLEDSLLEGQAMNDIFASVNRTRFAGSDLETAEEDWRDSRRNVLQVLRADMVYAVAYRSNPSPETPTLDIGGGTGWACQCYVNRFVGEVRGAGARMERKWWEVGW